jgi:low temperature requirement protein LtrA
VPGRGRRVDIEHTEIAAGHLIERFRLFFIIVLGETVLTMGSSFAGTPFEPARLFALVIGFTGTVALPRSSSSAWQPGATHAPESWVSSRWRYSPPPRPH